MDRISDESKPQLRPMYESGWVYIYITEEILVMNELKEKHLEEFNKKLNQ